MSRTVSSQRCEQPFAFGLSSSGPGSMPSAPSLISRLSSRFWSLPALQMDVWGSSAGGLFRWKRHRLHPWCFRRSCRAFCHLVRQADGDGLGSHYSSAMTLLKANFPCLIFQVHLQLGRTDVGVRGHDAPVQLQYGCKLRTCTFYSAALGRTTSRGTVLHCANTE